MFKQRTQCSLNIILYKLMFCNIDTRPPSLGFDEITLHKRYPLTKLTPKTPHLPVEIIFRYKPSVEGWHNLICQLTSNWITSVIGREWTVRVYVPVMPWLIIFHSPSNGFSIHEWLTFKKKSILVSLTRTWFFIKMLFIFNWRRRLIIRESRDPGSDETVDQLTFKAH